MISAIIPLSHKFELNALTIFSVWETLKKESIEFILLQRKNSQVDPKLICSNNLRIVDGGDLRYGELINLGVSQTHDQSDILLLFTPGTTMMGLSSNDLRVFEKKRYSIVGLKNNGIRNKKTNRITSYPSWSAMFTKTKIFKRIGGFCDYFPVWGGDFVYMIQGQKYGKVGTLNNKIYQYDEYKTDEPGLLELHKEMFIRRAPRIMSSLGLKHPILKQWPGIKEE